MAIVRKTGTSYDGGKVTAWYEYDGRNNQMTTVGCANGGSAAIWLRVTRTDVSPPQSAEHTCQPGESTSANVKPLNIVGTPMLDKFGNTYVQFPVTLEDRYPA